MEKDSDEIEFLEEDLLHANKLKKLKHELKTCQTEKEEYLRGWQRAKADFINSKREIEMQEKILVTYAEERIFKELLEIIDTFEKAIDLLPANDGWATGIRQIYDGCLRFLRRHGIYEMIADRKAFDPHLHEAIEVIEAKQEGDDGIVTRVLQKGYMHGDHILRPAKVQVAKHGGHITSNVNTNKHE